MTDKYRDALNDARNGIIAARHADAYREALAIAQKLEEEKDTCPHKRIDHNGECLDCDEPVWVDQTMTPIDKAIAALEEIREFFEENGDIDQAQLDFFMDRRETILYALTELKASGLATSVPDVEVKPADVFGYMTGDEEAISKIRKLQATEAQAELLEFIGNDPEKAFREIERAITTSHNGKPYSETIYPQLANIVRASLQTTSHLASGVKDGVWVPREPTEEMLDAIVDQPYGANAAYEKLLAAARDGRD